MAKLMLEALTLVKASGNGGLTFETSASRSLRGGNLIVIDLFDTIFSCFNSAPT